MTKNQYNREKQLCSEMSTFINQIQTLKPLSGHRTIGNLEIFAEMDEAGSMIYSIFVRRGGPPLLIAQMQQGKTGTVIVVIDKFISCCEVEKVPYEVIYLNNISSNDLKDQTENRLMQAGLLGKVRIIHHADIRRGKFSFDKNAKRRLIIVDECHWALGKNKPLHKMFKSLGVNYGESIDTWANKEVYVLSVSATPFASIIQSKVNDRSFQPVVLKVSVDYYSLKDMKNSDRLFQSDQVVRNGKVTQFFTVRMKEFEDRCKEHGPGFMVVRSTGKGPELLLEYIKRNYPEMDARVFESMPVNNINRLDEMLSITPAKPFISIIKGCMRAGKTLTTTKNIRLWLEPPQSKTDTMCQAVGRCVGYEMIPTSDTDQKRNRRFDDVFPIYCNLSQINEALEFFDKVGSDHSYSVPDGQYNGNTRETVIKVIRSVLTEEEARQNGYVISKCSAWNWNNMAQIILDLNYNRLPTEGNSIRDNRACLMDGPNLSKPEHLISWNKLKELHPECVGKCVHLRKISEQSVNTYENKLKPTVMFKQ